MPSANETKEYVENGYYHIYNRGVEKRLIFQDEQDSVVFLSYLKEYLLPKNEEELSKKLSDQNLPYKERVKTIRLLRMNNFADEITLLAYCLMPNHFHMLIKQKSASSIDKFMNSMATRYTMYFNQKYKRVGPLYQGVYKAVLITRDEQLLHLTRYIHQNPQGKKKHLEKSHAENLLYSQPSSYPEYAGKRKTMWIKCEEILAYFSKTNSKFSYEAFVNSEENFEKIAKLTIDAN